jgi:hypothetical protein
MSILGTMPDTVRLDSALKPNRSLVPMTSPLSLIDRITFGFTKAEYQLARSLGYAGYLEYQLNHLGIDDSALDARLAGAEFPTLAMTPETLALTTTGDVQNQLIRARLIRAVFTKRQLFERMVDFWTDHFNIWLYDGIATNQKTWDDSTVVRPFALSTFPEMLAASAHSPTMLDYLNNNTNTAGSPNENYAREIMELHTLGVDGGYTQTDVQQVARCFTGWTYYGGSTTPTNLRYTFRYNPGTHDNGQKIVLGHIIPAGGGQLDGETVLKILAGHASTARFIAKKMLRHLWGDEPPQTLITRIAQVYTNTQGDIKAMIRAILDPALDPPREPKFKRPFHHMVSALRATGAAIVAPGNLQNALVLGGHSPFNWNPPDGYPDTLIAWSGLLLPRWNFGASLMNGEYGSTAVVVDINALLAGVPIPLTPAGVVKRINELLFGGYMPGNEVVALTNYLSPGTPTTAKVREAFGLAIGSPAFQWS